MVGGCGRVPQVPVRRVKNKHFPGVVVAPLPPSRFIFPKSEMKEWEGEWKSRVLFSYYQHPLRYYGRLIGYVAMAA